jgi:hypothetical protein
MLAVAIAADTRTRDRTKNQADIPASVAAVRSPRDCKALIFKRFTAVTPSAAQRHRSRLRSGHRSRTSPLHSAAESDARPVTRQMLLVKIES